MARCPFARWEPLPENATQPRIRPTQAIVHTAVDQPGPTNLGRFFARADVTVESHFWITLDGTIHQLMDTERRADANRFANVRAVSIETEDDGDPERIPWTASQVASIVKLLRWLHEVHGIPLKLCPAWDQPGLGYHSLFGFADPVNLIGVKDNPWSVSRGKTCPGKTRIKQFREVILPLCKEEDMTPEESTMLRELHAVWVKNRRERHGDHTSHDLATPVLETNGRSGPIYDWTLALAHKQGLDPDEVAKAVANRVAGDVALAVSGSMGAALRAAGVGDKVDVDAITSIVVDAVVKRLED